jgi:predicted RNA-binding protein with TRAM domain
VPDTDVGERVNVRINEAKENVALAEVVKRYDSEL